MRRLLPVLVLISALFLPLTSSGTSKGIQVKTKSGEVLPLYDGSYALLIGMSDYTAGWPRLPNVPKELDAVGEVLKDQGFEVVRKDNLTGRELDETFKAFIDKYGYDRRNRLLFFFSGHGHTMRDGSKGYLLPKDAPDPRENEKEFLRKSLSMDQILAWSRDMNAKHALFLFDSCFSGTIFKAKDLPNVPPDISKMTALPVRQYLTAGDAGESVPAKSTFTPAFVDALKYGLGDMDKDGYISGTELGLYLRKEVPKHEDQTPQFGNIRDYELSRGDFVFIAQQGAQWSEPEPPGPKPDKKTGHLEIRASVNGTRVDGARVYMDGKDMGEAPAFVPDVPAGRVRVRIIKEGYEPWEDEMEIQSGRKRIVRASLTAVRPKPARLYVRTVPSDAAVRILNIAPRFSQGMELAAGRYHLEVSAEGYEAHEEWIDLDAGEDRDVEIRLTAVPPKPSQSSERTGKTLVDRIAGVEFTFAYIPPGTFMMGSPSNEPGRVSNETQHQVTLSKGFYLQTTEITQGQWKAVMGSNPSEFKNCGDDCPVENISWNDCQEFIGKLNRLAGGHRYRLPTEAEWEYAARAGSTGRYPWGDEPRCDKMNYENDPGSSETRCVSYAKSRGLPVDSTVPAGSYDPNAWGLYDMHGNVWEWVQDWYGDYPGGSVTDPTGPSSGSGRVIRGGSWLFSAGFCRSASRYILTPGNRSRSLGARLLRSYP